MIESQYFEGCPNSQESLINLRKFMEKTNIPEDKLIITLIENEEMSKLKTFQGSPTILINGLDLYTGKRPEESNFSCRLYRIDNSITGVLSIEYISQRYKELLSSETAVHKTNH